MSDFIDSFSEIDNNNENTIIEENIILHDHIDDARSLLKKFNTIVNEDPIIVVDNDKKIRIMLSEIILTLNEQIKDLRLISEDLYVYTNSTKQLSDKIKPYCYRECSTSLEIFKKMSIMAENQSMSTEQVIINLEDIEKNINNLRRLYESIICNI
jgi:hypothetical protein